MGERSHFPSDPRAVDLSEACSGTFCKMSYPKAMNAASEELSRDRRFMLVRITDESNGIERLRVRLDLAGSRDCVLDLSDAGSRIDTCRFDAGDRALLHLRVSREDGAIVMYPATLDLDTGLYYHGDPRQAHAPAGQAADLEGIARGDGAPPEFDRTRAVRWPSPERLAGETLPKLEHPQATPVVEQSIPEPDIDTQKSTDGRWQLESWHFEGGPDDFRGHARIIDTLNNRIVFDLHASNWYSQGRFNPAAYQLWLTLQHADARQWLRVFIDLDCLLYWETDAAGNLAQGPFPLRALEQRLKEPPARQKPNLHAVAPPLAVPPAMPLKRRSITSPDGRFRVDLFPSGRSETNARGETKPYYHALFTDIERGRVIADTRDSKEEAWLEGPDGFTMNLSTPAETRVWVAVDLSRGECWLENFREPISNPEPMEKLRMLLSQAH